MARIIDLQTFRDARRIQTLPGSTETPQRGHTIELYYDSQGLLSARYDRPLDDPQRRSLANDLELLARWLRLQAESNAGPELDDMMAILRIRRSSDMHLWLHSDLGGESHLDWLERRFDDAKGMAENLLGEEP